MKNTPLCHNKTEYFLLQKASSMTPFLFFQPPARRPESTCDCSVAALRMTKFRHSEDNILCPKNLRLINFVTADEKILHHSDASQNLSMLITWYFLVPTRKYRKEALDLMLRSLIKVTVSRKQVNSLSLKQHLL